MESAPMPWRRHIPVKLYKQYDKCYNGRIQDATECLLKIIYVINKCWMSYSGSNNNFTVVASYDVFLSHFLFSFILETYILCGLRFPTFQSSNVSFITLAYSAYGMWELILRGMQQQLQKYFFY